MTKFKLASIFIFLAKIKAIWISGKGVNAVNERSLRAKEKKSQHEETAQKGKKKNLDELSISAYNTRMIKL